MRDAFHEDLDRISDQLVEMTRLAGSAMTRATTALLDADLALAESVIAADKDIDTLREGLDALSVDLLARQQPVATDLRMVVTAMRMSADLERMGDLARHVAKVARLRYPESAVPADVRSTVLQMGQVAERIVAKCGSIIAAKDVESAKLLDAEDDAMWTRFLPHTDVVRQVLEQGLLGDLDVVFADHGQHLHPGGPARLSQPELAGGALLDLGVYPLSFASFVLGPFATVTATGTLTDLGVDAQEAITVTNAAGAQGVLHATMTSRTPCGASVCGTRGRLEFGTAFYAPTWVRLHGEDGEVVDQFDSLPADAEQGLRYEAAEAARCLAAGRLESELLPWDETLRVMTAMDTVRAQLGVVYPGE